MQTEPTLLAQLRYVEPVIVLAIFLGVFALSVFLVRSANQTEWVLARILQLLDRNPDAQKTVEF
jgi:hypothetical protein